MRARRLRWSSIHCSDALAKTRSSPSSSQVAMSPWANERPATSRVVRLGPGQHRRRRVDARPSPRPAISSCRILVRSPVPHPRSTMRPPGTGWHSVSRSSKGCWRSERNRSYWSGLHPSIGVTVTALMSSPSRDARRPRAARRAATPRLTWANGSRAAPARSTQGPAARRHDRPVERTGRAPVDAGLGRRRARASSTVSRLPRNVVQARPRRTTRLSCDGRLGPVEMEVLRGDLLRHGRPRPAAARARASPATPSASASTTSVLATVDQLARAARRG